MTDRGEAAAELPPTRWALGGAKNVGYGERFAELAASGEDIVGEARLADVLVGRGAHILDAGSGMGRIAAYLRAQGHHVVATEPDPSLVEQSRATYPDLPVLPHEILAVTPQVLRAAGAPLTFDLIVCVGNVMTFVAPGTEVDVLRRLGDLLAPAGRILLGFHLAGGPSTARRYRAEEFIADATEAGLRIDQRFGGYDLRPPDDEYAVWILSRPGG
jgi:SAM-dependent methyltransferase